MVQTVTWLSGLRKSLRFDLSVRSSQSNAVSVSPRRMAFLDIALILLLLITRGGSRGEGQEGPPQ